MREVAGLIAAQRNEDALRAADRLAQAYPDWRPVDLVRTWIYARDSDEAAEMAAVTRYRAGFFDVEDAHYGPWASALWREIDHWAIARLSKLVARES